MIPFEGEENPRNRAVLALVVAEEAVEVASLCQADPEAVDLPSVWVN